MNSTNGIAFVINVWDDTKLPKLNPEAVSSKMEVPQTLVNRRALSPDIRNTYIGICNLPKESKFLDTIKIKKLRIRLKSQDQSNKNAKMI